MSHASDCALHNAPAAPPQPCTCGASPRFRLFDYDINNDSFAWKKVCREYLIGEVAAQALARIHSVPRPQVVRVSVAIERAARCGFTGNEAYLILQAWDRCFAPLTPDEIERRGIDDRVAYDTGAFVSATDRALYSIPPTMDEVVAALSLWFEHWATLDEPVISIGGHH